MSTRRHFTRSSTAVLAAASMALTGLGLIAAGPARAAGFVPPTPPHDIFVLPMQDAITTTQDPNAAVTINVVRNGVVVGTASGTADSAGVFEVNHPGGICFTDHTPLIVPGDLIQVQTAAGVAEQTLTQNISAGPTINNAGVIEIHGNAANAAGGQLPINELDVRIINASRFAINGRRDIRAGGPAGPTGTLTYDTPTGTAFTARWATLSAGDQLLAMSGAARADWLGVAAAGNEGTVYDVGAVPFPLPQCIATAPLASYGVTSADHPTINAANAGLPLTLSGLAQDATSATVSLTDGAATSVTVPVTLSAPAGAQTWTATIPAAQIATLADGVLTAAGSYTTAAGVLTGATLSLTKKVTLPPAPVLAPAPGTYPKAQQVTVTDTDPTAVLHLTTDGTAPTAASPVLKGTVSAPIGTTTIRVVAVDTAGNVSVEAGGAYVVSIPVPTHGATLNPASVSFTTQQVGTKGPAAGLVLINTGTAALGVTSASVDGADADAFTIDAANCAAVATGSSCAPSVSFRPLHEGQSSARAVLETTAGQLTASLSGTATAGRTGYWLVGKDGAVFNFGDAPFLGSLAGVSIPAPAAAMASTPTGNGYWLATADGLVFAFGDATSYGSMQGQSLKAPIVGMAATPSGQGYWLLGRDGGIFSFGDAAFFGSTGGMTLNQPVLGIAATPSGHGYWLVASDGGIFAFGDAPFYGSTGSIRLNKPIVGMESTPSGHGYWLVASDGGIFSYGDAAFLGSTGSIKLNKPIVGMTNTVTGRGYMLIASDGGIFAYGDARFQGSTGGASLAQPIIGGAALRS